MCCWRDQHWDYNYSEAFLPLKLQGKTQKMVQLIPSRATTSLYSVRPVSDDYCKNQPYYGKCFVWPMNTLPATWMWFTQPDPTPHAKCAQCRLLTYEVPCCRPDMGDARFLPRVKHMDSHSFIPFRHQKVVWLFLICQHKNHHWCWTKKIPVDLHHAWLDGTRLWRNFSSQILFWGNLISIDCC